jgi:hypothetical protein
MENWNHELACYRELTLPGTICEPLPTLDSRNEGGQRTKEGVGMISHVWMYSAKGDRGTCNARNGPDRIHDD